MPAWRAGTLLWGVSLRAPHFLTLSFRSVSPYNLIRFSERLAWSTPQNAYSLLLSKSAPRVPLLDLAISNPTEALAAYPHRDIAQAYAAIPSFRYEPAALGHKLAREAVVRWYADHGITAAPERIALTASTSEAMRFSSNCFATQVTKCSFPALLIRYSTIWLAGICQNRSLSVEL